MEACALDVAEHALQAVAAKEAGAADQLHRQLHRADRVLRDEGAARHHVVDALRRGLVALKRKAGEWHPLFQIIASTAFPLVYAVYLGLAERARDIAIGMAKQRRPGDDLLTLAGRMETALRAARLAHDWMVRAVERNQPSAESVNDAMTGRTLVAENAIRTVELAMELVGGAGFHRRNGLERLFRDIQGARFHPLQPGPQARYAGAMALGLPVSRIF